MKTEKFTEMSKDAYNRYKLNITKEQKTLKNMFELGYQAALIEHSKMIEDYECSYNLSHGIVVTETIPCELINEFFNSKSDANKYLNAEQQEDLEKEFCEYVKAISYTL